jgi:hypothetical protein
MPKRISQSELDSIVKVIGSFPEGAGVEGISKALAGSLPRRTLQRRLALLVEQKQISIEGRGRASRYHLSVNRSDLPIVLSAVKADMHGELYVPISSEGEEIRQAVREPIQNRHPVGYNRDFLDSYHPNDTFYLSSDIRQKLYEMGRSPEGNRPAGTYARKIFNRLLIDLSWNSSRLEGNTYSLLETEILLGQGELAEGRNAMEAQMLLNHKAAIELLVEQASETGFNRYTICNLHGLLSNNLLSNPQACGRLRTIPVGIGKTVYYPLEMPQLIDECFGQVLAIAGEVKDPFEQAFFAMVHLPYLQPFEDINKRVSRLAANIPLIRQNLCPLSFVDVVDRAYIDGIVAVYELNRVDLLRDIFIWAYQRSCARYSAFRQSIGEPDPFRFDYRVQISDFIAEVVRRRLGKVAAANWIAEKTTAEISANDRVRFVEVIETELGSLHEGNIARYRLRPVEYMSWKQGWR